MKASRVKRRVAYRNTADDQLRAQFAFDIGIGLEITYALQTVIDAESRIHPEWTASARRALPATFDTAVRRVGASSDLWPMIADALPGGPPTADFDDLVQQLRDLDLRTLQSEILFGVLHYRDVVDRVLRGENTLGAALSSVPAEKREWYAFIGLFPFDARNELAAGLQHLIDDPESFRASVIEILE